MDDEIVSVMRMSDTVGGLNGCLWPELRLLCVDNLGLDRDSRGLNNAGFDRIGLEGSVFVSDRSALLLVCVRDTVKHSWPCELGRDKVLARESA